jgi:hypothetical protein
LGHPCGHTSNICAAHTSPLPLSVADPPCSIHDTPQEVYWPTLVIPLAEIRTPTPSSLGHVGHVVFSSRHVPSSHVLKAASESGSEPSPFTRCGGECDLAASPLSHASADVAVEKLVSPRIRPHSLPPLRAKDGSLRLSLDSFSSSQRCHHAYFKPRPSEFSALASPSRRRILLHPGICCDRIPMETPHSAMTLN